MSTQFIVILIIVGLAAGILSGLVGIGGGVILVPCLVYFLKFTQHQAQGTSIGVLLMPVALLSFLSYYNNLKGTPQQLDFKIIFLISIGFFVGALIGSKVAFKINGDVLKKYLL